MATLKSIEDIENWQKESGQRDYGLPTIFQSSSIRITAKGCVLRFGKNAKLINSHAVMEADDAELSIGSDTEVKFSFRIGNKSRIIIGDRFYSTGGGLLSASEGTTLRIGNDCLFAIQMDLRTDHAHPIFDRRTGKRTNPSQDVTIGDHVWLGPYARVYPGAVIGEGCVIGSGSLVNSTVPPNTVAIGVPAKVVRRNIVWDRTHLSIRRPWRFDSVSDLPTVWQSQHPIEIENRRAEWRNAVGRRVDSSWIKAGIAGAAGAALFEVISVFLT